MLLPPTSFVAQALVASPGNEVLTHFDVPESGSIMQSRVAVVILNVGVQLVLLQKNRRELVVPPIRGLVQRAPSAASFKRVDIGFGREAPDLHHAITRVSFIVEAKKTPAPMIRAWPTP